MAIGAEDLTRLLVEHLTPGAPPQDLHRCLAELAQADGHGDSINHALELVEALVPEVQDRLDTMRNAAIQNGTTWNIELFGSGKEWVRGASFDDPGLPAEDRTARSRRAFANEAKAALLGLTYRDFEFACATVLRLLGCQDPRTTRQSNDGGIDFHGRLELRGRLDSPFPYGGLDDRAKVWLIGQAKHYPTSNLAPAVVREMVGTAELARTGGALQEWPGLRLRPFDASLILIFTTGGFSVGAKALLERSGMLSMDGNQLTTFLCDAGIGIQNEDSVFDASLFRQQLVDAAKLHA
ncbi:restriction endonuclease [Arsenicicoccus piscis]|uniref:restriction endonuclease n=1 Tax=Arsenicicoccus piscis TaxID=673954 RepID=UPI001F4D13EB|nr:restriction endonuclease [Arsenicicoccus piscis]MCH8628982.1 restriction endonuclease [Arsenicicoccus piscis]